MADRDPEDVFDEIMIAVLRTIGKYAWTVADHVFKLTAWLLGFSAILALGQSTDDIGITVIGIVLSSVWLAAAVTTIFKTTVFLQDAALERWVDNKTRHPLIRIGLAAAVTATIVIPSIEVFGFVMQTALKITARIVST